MLHSGMKFRGLACAGALLLASTAAQAIGITDVTYRGKTASQALLSSGNDTTSAINTLFDPDWTLLLKSDDGNAGSFGGVDFMTSGFSDASAGKFLLSWVDTAPTGDLPLVLDLALVLKAGNQYAAYLFEGLTFNDEGGNAGSGTGKWKITYTNVGNQVPDLSHASLYVRVSDDPQRIPVPGSLLLLGTGLLGLRLGLKRQQTT